jgi:hypothetical protein
VGTTIVPVVSVKVVNVVSVAVQIPVPVPVPVPVFVSKDIGVRGEGMALLGSMMERWDGFGLMMDGGMANDAATTIAVSPTPPGAADASLPPADFRGTWTIGEDDAAPNPMPPNPGGWA